MGVRRPRVAVLPGVAPPGGGEHLWAVGDAVVGERLRPHEREEFVRLDRRQERGVKVNALPVYGLLHFGPRLGGPGGGSLWGRVAFLSLDRDNLVLRGRGSVPRLLRSLFFVDELFLRHVCFSHFFKFWGMRSGIPFSIFQFVLT